MAVNEGKQLKYFQLMEDLKEKIGELKKQAPVYSGGGQTSF